MVFSLWYKNENSFSWNWTSHLHCIFKNISTIISIYWHIFSPKYLEDNLFIWTCWSLGVTWVILFWVYKIRAIFKSFKRMFALMNSNITSCYYLDKHLWSLNQSILPETPLSNDTMFLICWNSARSKILGSLDIKAFKLYVWCSLIAAYCSFISNLIKFDSFPFKKLWNFCSWGRKLCSRPTNYIFV